MTCEVPSLEFLGFTGAPPEAQRVECLPLGPGGPYFGVVAVDDAAVLSGDFDGSRLTTVSFVLTPAAAPDGRVHAGQATVKLCADPGCGKVVWSRDLRYTVAIHALDPVQLALSAPAAGEVARTVAISPPDTAGRLAVSTSTQDGGGWLVATRASADGLAVKASAAGLAPGGHAGVVAVSFSGQEGAPRLELPVSLTVGDGLVVPTPATLTLDRAATAETLRGTAPVRFGGGQRAAWTATSDQAWLRLSTAAGVGDGALAYAVDVSGVAGFSNWSSAVARVTVQAQGFTDAVFAVILDKKLPEVYTVSPGVVPPGSAGPARVTGRGLRQLASASQIQVDGVPAAAGTILSDTEATLTLPALSAGRRVVSIPGASGLSGRSGALVVAVPGSLGQQTLANAGVKRGAVFDPARSALFAVNQTSGTLVRFTLGGAQPRVDTLRIDAIDDLALAPDGARLYVGAGLEQLVQVDPDALAETGRYILPNAPHSDLRSGAPTGAGMAVTSNLRIWFGGARWSSPAYFDLRTHQFGAVQPPDGDGWLYDPRFYASADGSMMVVAQAPLDDPPDNVRYSTAADAFDAPAGEPKVVTRVALERTGARALVDGATLYRTADWTVLGTIPAPASGLGFTAVLSPDGMRVYRLATAAGSQAVDHLDVFDTTLAGSGAAVAPLGAIPIAGRATTCDVKPASGCEASGILLVAPLGDALFWVGDAGLVVVPIPAALRPSNSARGGGSRTTGDLLEHRSR